MSRPAARVGPQKTPVPIGLSRCHGSKPLGATPTPILVLILIVILIAARPGETNATPRRPSTFCPPPLAESVSPETVRRYAWYGVVRRAVRVRHQKHPMFIGLGTAVRLQHPTGHPPQPVERSGFNRSGFKVPGPPPISPSIAEYHQISPTITKTHPPSPPGVGHRTIIPPFQRSIPASSLITQIRRARRPGPIALKQGFWYS